MSQRLQSFWKSYKYRFVPWLAVNFKNRNVRRVGDGGVGDMVVEREEILHQLRTLTTNLHHVSPPAYYHHHHYHQQRSAQLEYHCRALDVMEKVYGFRVYRTESQLGGLGVVAVVSGHDSTVGNGGRGGSPRVNVQSGGNEIKDVKRVNSLIMGGGGGNDSGRVVSDSDDDTVVAVRRGQLVALYPGTLYLPHQPIFFQSINNSFIFRCADGILIDGNDKRLSKFIYKSCSGRDQAGLLSIADTTWLTLPNNPLNVGQYVNNQSSDRGSNVAYQEVTLQPGEVRDDERRFLPNLWYSPPSHTPSLDLPLRIVALVATRDIVSGEELLSDYFTVIS